MFSGILRFQKLLSRIPNFQYLCPAVLDAKHLLSAGRLASCPPYHTPSMKPKSPKPIAVGTATCPEGCRGLHRKSRWPSYVTPHPRITQPATVMKTRYIILLALSLFALAGCESLPETSDIAVRRGMTRDDLKLHFGEPLRIEAAASGGEDWYYRFVSWKTTPTGESGTSVDPGGTTSYVSVELQTSRDTGEQPIHVSSEGYVIEPLPNGKVVQK